LRIKLQFASGDVFQRSLYSSIDASVCLNSVTTVFLLARSSHFLVRSTPVVRTRGSHFQFTFYRFAISQFANYQTRMRRHVVQCSFVQTFIKPYRNDAAAVYAENKHIKFIKHQRLLVYYSKPTFTSDGHVGADYAGFYGWKVAWMNNQFSWGSAATDLRWGGQFNSIFGERNIQIRQHLTKWKQSIIYRQNRRLGWRLSQSMMPLWLPTEVDVSTCSLPSKPSNAEYVETARSWRRRTDRCRL